VSLYDVAKVRYSVGVPGMKVQYSAVHNAIHGTSAVQNAECKKQHIVEYMVHYTVHAAVYSRQ
jgi:hypothetical protein